MQPFIRHSLTMLEDLGMRTRYPDIRWYTQNDEGDNRFHLSISDIVGRRVTIEQNQQMKFLMMFALLDFYVDSTYLDLEGASFAQKYKKLPAETAAVSVTRLPNANLLTFHDIPSAFLALQQGKVDGLVAGRNILARFANESAQKGGQQYRMLATPVYEERWGVVMNKNEPALMAAVNKILHD